MFSFVFLAPEVLRTTRPQPFSSLFPTEVQRQKSLFTHQYYRIYTVFVQSLLIERLEWCHVYLFTQQLYMIQIRTFLNRLERLWLDLHWIVLVEQFRFLTASSSRLLWMWIHAIRVPFNSIPVKQSKLSPIIPYIFLAAQKKCFESYSFD